MQKRFFAIFNTAFLFAIILSLNFTLIFGNDVADLRNNIGLEYINQQVDIVDYDPAYKNDIVQLFEQNKKFLFSSASSVESMLDSYLEDPSTINIKMLKINGQLAGIVVYYTKKDGQGYVNYLAVKDEFRGKKFGEQLINYAVNQLAQVGNSLVSLWTSSNNIRAQNLYKKVGFYVHEYQGTGMVFHKQVQLA